MMTNSTIVVIGDKIRDVFHEGTLNDQKFNVSKTIRRAGGANNTQANLQAILEEHDNAYIYSPLTATPYALVRLINNQDYKLINEYWDTDKNHSELYKPRFIDSNPNTLSTLVISDYNKGSVSRSIPGQELIEWELAVVDSRYRSVDPAYVAGAKTSIWHATGEEYDWKWSQNFDYVYWTNGPETVWFGPTDKRTTATIPDWDTLDVPKTTKVLDTIGAGDTFTAAIAGYLIKQHPKPIDMDILRAAGEFAVNCCQEVIQTRYTEVTTLRL